MSEPPNTHKRKSAEDIKPKRRNNTPARRKAVWDKSNGICWYCGKLLHRDRWTIDHVVPRARWMELGYGVESIKNLVPCCRICNHKKADMDLEQFRDELQRPIVRALQGSNNYKRAVSHGLLPYGLGKFLFWFELGISDPIPNKRTDPNL